MALRRLPCCHQFSIPSPHRIASNVFCSNSKQFRDTEPHIGSISAARRPDRVSLPSCPSSKAAAAPRSGARLPRRHLARIRRHAHPARRRNHARCICGKRHTPKNFSHPLSTAVSCVLGWTHTLVQLGEEALGQISGQRPLYMNSVQTRPVRAFISASSSQVI